MKWMFWLWMGLFFWVAGCDDGKSHTVNNNSNNINLNNSNNQVNNSNNINNNNNDNDAGVDADVPSVDVPDASDVTDAATDADGGENPPQPVTFTALTFNIGNPDADHPTYPLRMWSQSYENYIGAVIQAMAPDVVVLQEVLSGKTCEAFTEIDPNKTCYQWDTRPRPAQRIIGPGYTIVCDQREQVECIGVKVAFGTIDGVDPGQYVETGALTPALPLPGCNWAAGECTNSKCDDESTVSAVLVHTAAGPLRVVHMHPMAQVSAFVSGDPCRAKQIRQVFENDVIAGDLSLIRPGEQALILGDWNLGLEIYNLRTIMGPSEADDVWNQYIDCPACPYTDMDPRDPSGQRYSTNSQNSWAGIVAIDHVVASNEITGSCTIYDEGGMPGTEPLDAGYPHLSQLGEGRIDHYAIFCEMTLLPPAP